MESDWYEGVQTFMWMTEDNIVEVTFDKEHLLEAILDPMRRQGGQPYTQVSSQRCHQSWSVRGERGRHSTGRPTKSAVEQHHAQ